MSTLKLWWENPLRVIQTNLQVADTDQIKPKELAAQIKAMGANTLVFNVGGIYAWYKTEIPFHNQNEFLPANQDLLKEVIDACHEQNIRFVARFDFSKTEDSTYLQKPQWFVRKPDGQPLIVGEKRPGKWSLLMMTCINSAYRNDAVAIPVLDEVLTKYETDGIFFNAPGFEPCHCETCRRKYAAKYKKELPASPELYEPDWATSCMQDNMDNIYRFIKGKKREVPMILYYNLYRDSIFDREETTDMLCTEPQDVLSLGHKNIPEFWKPALSMKLGRSLPHRPNPFGIVHSSPGMDWRHTGLPTAEYLFWLSQIPAHGGQIWHSLTGIPDTIDDKRIIKTVTELNQMILKSESYMDGALPRSQVAMLWNADRSAEGWADGLINKQIPFDMLLVEQADTDRLKKYKILIIPDSTKLTERLVSNIIAYVKQGGNVILEGKLTDQFPELFDLLGIEQDVVSSEALVASYLRFEGEENPLQKHLEETSMIAHRGITYYCTPKKGTKVLATLVPPFSPLDSVGRPPERASLLVSHTDLPLCCVNSFGKGKAVYLPFLLSQLLNEFKLEEHYLFTDNLIDMLLGEGRFIRVSSYQGLQLTVFEKNQQLLVHLINGVGRRPLSVNVPLHNIELEIRLQEKQVVERVRLLISEDHVAYRTEGNRLFITVEVLKVWETILIELKPE